MRNRDAGSRRWAALLGVALLTGCYSPGDAGHRIYGYVDSQGEVAIEPAFLDARAFSEGLAAVQVAGGWGYIDRDGRWVIPPRYSAAASFADGRAAVRDERRLWGYVDTTGRVVVPPRFQRASRFVDGRAYGLLPDGQVESIDRDGRIAASALAKEHASLGDASMEFSREESSEHDPDVTLQVRRADRALVEAVIGSDRLPVWVKIDGQFRAGYDDLAGRRMIEPTFDDAGPFIDGLARVKSEDGYGFIRPDGSVAVPLEFESALLRFSAGRTLVVSDDRAWLIDTSGRRVADLGPWEWPEIADEDGFDDLERYVGLDDFFVDGLIPWQRSGRWGYVDRDGRWTVEPRFDAVQPFHGGLASVTEGGRGRLIDTRGRTVRDVGGATIAPPDRGLVRIGTETRWGFEPAKGGQPDEVPFATRRLAFAGATFVDHRPLDVREDRALVSRMAPHNWLLLDDQGRIRASADLEWLEEAGSGVYAFVEDQRWGLADDRLRQVSAQRYDAKPDFEDDPPAAMVSTGQRTGCIDRRGRWVLEFDSAAILAAECSGQLLPAVKGLPQTGRDPLVGVVDRAGRWRIPPQFEDLHRVPGPPGAHYFLLDVGEQKSLAVVTARGWRRSAPADFETCAHANACFACGPDGCRRLDPRRLQLEGPVYDEVKSGDSDGDVMVRRGSSWGYRLVSGQFTLPVEYGDIDLDYLSGPGWAMTTARVSRNGRWGVASLDSGSFLVPLRYDELGSVSEGRYVMREGSAWGLVAADGRVLVPPVYEEIRAVRGTLLLAKENGRWVLVTTDGRALPDPPDWVQRIFALADHSDGAWAALTQDARLYFVDKRTMAVREASAPMGYRWCTKACYSGPEFHASEFDRAVPIEAEGRPRRYVLFDSAGRSALPLLNSVRDVGPFGARAGPYIVWVAGRCGVVTREGRWLAPPAYDHCNAMNRGPGFVMLGREAYAIPAVALAGRPHATSHIADRNGVRIGVRNSGCRCCVPRGLARAGASVTIGLRRVTSRNAAALEDLVAGHPGDADPQMRECVNHVLGIRRRLFVDKRSGVFRAHG